MMEVHSSPVLKCKVYTSVFILNSAVIAMTMLPNQFNRQEYSESSLEESQKSQKNYYLLHHGILCG